MALCRKVSSACLYIQASHTLPRYLLYSAGLTTPQSLHSRLATTKSLTKATSLWPMSRHTPHTVLEWQRAGPLGMLVHWLPLLHCTLTLHSPHAATLHNPARAPMSVAVEDKFIRKFITGTWYKMWLSEVVIKRVHNNVLVCGLVCPLPSIKTLYFLIGYTETLLSNLLKCNVRLEIQCVRSKKELVYKLV